MRLATGGGVVLEGAGAPFHDAPLRPAQGAEIAAWLARRAPAGAALEAGEPALAPGVPLALDAAGWSGTRWWRRPGAGRTHALGVLLEQILLAGAPRVVVLDAGSELSGLTRVRGEVDARTARRYARVAAFLDVLDGARLRLRSATATWSRPRAALLRLEPLADADDHAALLAAAAPTRGRARQRQRLAQRARNLGADALGVFAGDGEPVPDAAADDGRRGLVADLGGLASAAERALVVAAVLARLWEGRAGGEPTLVVITEADALCPAAPGDALTALAAVHVARIAAEGRRHGLRLLLATGRPRALAPELLGRCDNLVLLRAAPADAAAVGAGLPFAPAGLVALAPHLGPARGDRRRTAVRAAGALPLRRAAHGLGRRRGPRARVGARHAHRGVQLGAAPPRNTPLIGGTSA